MKKDQELHKELDEVQHLFQAESKDLALKKLEKIIKKNDKSYLPYNYRGIIYLYSKKFDLAIQDFKKAIALNPQFSEAYCNLGNTYLALNHYEKSTEAYKCAVKINPNNLEAQINFGILNFKMGEYKKAIAIYQSVLSKSIQNEYVHQLIADAYIQNSKFDKSIFHHQEAIKIHPQNGLNYFLLGRDYLWKSEKKLAIENIKKSLENNPGHCPSLFALSKLDSSELKPMITSMNLLVEKNISPLDKAFIFFSFSKVYEDQKDYDNSFNALVAGNKAMKEHNKFNFLDFDTKMRECINFFEKNFESLEISDDNFKNKKSPIFILGMPRSGSTLIEQVLSNHPSVFGAGELDTIHSSLYQLLQEKKVDKYLIKDFILRLKRKYYERLNDISEKSFIIDKLPLNFFWIGYIKKIFPNAKIIYSQRDPIAVSFSIFKTLFFDGSLEFSYSEEDIINFYKLHTIIMDYWINKFSKEILQVKHESFILNSEEEAKRIFDFIGLEFSPNYLNLNNNSRSVMTASDLQVRDKIKKESSNGWLLYESHLDKFKKAYIN